MELKWPTHDETIGVLHQIKNDEENIEEPPKTNESSSEQFNQAIYFLETRIQMAIKEPTLEKKIGDFISKRVDDLANTPTTLGEMFTPDAVNLVKEKAIEQIEPLIHQLTELATAERTRQQIGSLIKKEVHEYYEGLPFFKKIFVSRENLLGEVDDLVNESLPKRIEETLHGDFFAVEAINFLNSTIDNALGRRLRTTDAAHFKAAQAPLTVVAGALLGVLVTLTSVGAGALGAVFLAYLYPLRLTPPRLIATDLVHAIPLAMFAGMGHLLIGNVDGMLLVQLLLGSIPGVMVGAMLSARLPHTLLRNTLSVVLVLIGGKLAWTVMGN